MSSFIFSILVRLDSSSCTSCELRLAVSVEPPPPGLEASYQTLFTSNALQFVAELVKTFDKRVDELTSDMKDMKIQ
jgi:hypothetical protein